LESLFWPAAVAKADKAAVDQRLIADKILRDDGTATNLTFTEEEVSKPFGR